MGLEELPLGKSVDGGLNPTASQSLIIRNRGGEIEMGTGGSSHRLEGEQ